MQRVTTSIAEQAREIINRFKDVEGPLLPILHGLQDAFGHVPSEILPVIAHELNLSRADIYGVVSFYHEFRSLPAGRHVLKLCRAESCQAMGSDILADRTRELLGIDWHGTTEDGAITLEPVYCLGLCACAPAAMLDGELIGRLDEQKLFEIAADLRP